METELTESEKEPGRKSTTERMIKKNIAETEKHILNEKEVNELADIFFNQRIEHGEYGSAGNNWFMSDDRSRAEEYLRLRFNRNKHALEKCLIK
jgi:V8-like Glu-specific endopeptidase